MNSQIFAERLKEAMSDSGMKQVDLLNLAKEQGVKLGKSQLSQYVSGKTMPRPTTMNFLANALNVELRWLNPIEVAERPKKPKPSSVKKESEQAEPVEKNETTFEQEVRKDVEVQEEEIDLTLKLDVETAKAEADVAAGECCEPAPLRVFKKSSKLDNVLYDVRGPVLDEANRMEQAGTHVLKLNIGNPAPFGFRAVDEVVQDMAHQLTDCEGYSDSKGLWSARKAIMQYYQLKGLPNVQMEHIYTGNGVSELINICMSALLDNGDEILLPTPDYPLWTACATLAGGRPVHYVCDEDAEWNPDLDDIRKKITPRTKAIVIINPNNPTGALYSREVLEGIVDIAREHQLMIFSDEIYDRLVMEGEGEHISIASLAPDLFCVTFSGLSKSHMVAGYRIGWMAISGNKRLGKDYIEGLNMLTNMRLCSNVPAQSIVQTALWGHQSVHDYVVPGGRVYEQRNFVYEMLSNMPGVSVVKPKAAFYIFPKLDPKRFNITDDEKFALDLLKEKKILVVQGTGFNCTDSNHFRIVYLPRRRILGEAMESLADFLRYYRQ